jgi:CTP synthase (UTP-ammonia lyase)
LGIAQAEHEESAPTAAALVISRLACSLVGSTQTVMLAHGSLAHRLYGQASVTEEFSCNFGLNPNYRDQFANSDLRSVGTDTDGEVRMVELHTHPFFLATLFLPQIRSSAARPHPLITAYLQAASNLRPLIES